MMSGQGAVETKKALRKNTKRMQAARIFNTHAQTLDLLVHRTPYLPPQTCTAPPGRACGYIVFPRSLPNLRAFAIRQAHRGPQPLQIKPEHEGGSKTQDGLLTLDIWG